MQNNEWKYKRRYGYGFAQIFDSETREALPLMHMHTSKHGNVLLLSPKPV